MLMTIEFSRRIYQDLIICTLELVRYERFINHTCPVIRPILRSDLHRFSRKIDT